MTREEHLEKVKGKKQTGISVAERTDGGVVNSRENNDGRQKSLDSVLGLRCLSIVLSYLEEFEGTSLLLCRSQYWTDTILPLLRLPTESTITGTPKLQKHRHRMADRNKNPLVNIPDAFTRLDRLNTRRLNTRLRQNRDVRGSNADNLSTLQIAKIEWKETLSSKGSGGEEGKAGDDDDNKQDNGNVPLLSRRFRLIMNPPLLRFYDGESPPDSLTCCFKEGTTCLASYPRSGNSLLRSLLETATGFCTSSDTRPDRNLSVALAEKPPFFCGEGLAPKSTGGLDSESSSAFLPPEASSGRRVAPPPICKTHWPERIGCHAYDCQRVVLLVRNPFDATDSYWHMCVTNTHTKKVAPSVTEEHLDFYRALVRHEILQVWMGFLDYYWKECSRHNIPLLLVRYEDLVLSPRRELQRILEFSCNTNSNDGVDWWKRRLEEVTRDTDSKDSSSTSSTDKKRFGYQSSSTIGTDSSATASTKESAALNNHSISTSSHPSIGRSLRKGGNITPSILQVVHDLDDNGWLERLGYHVYRQNFPNNLDRLPPVPVLECSDKEDARGHVRSTLAINVPDVSLELRPRDSPYGRNMTHWRRRRTERDTRPFPTV